MRRRWIDALALWLVLLAPLAAAGDDDATVRLLAGREGAVWTGENAPVYLELWTSGMSFSGQSFVLPEVAGGYFIQPDSTTVKLTERRGGVAWQGIRYPLSLYPQKSGTLVIPSFEVRFSTRAAYDAEPVEHVFATGSLAVEVRQPPGADPGALLVTSRDFQLDASWEPAAHAGDEPRSLKTGDALVLTVRREARQVPGMVFAPLPTWRIDGLGIYADPPEVRDRVARGALTGTRTDRITVVCENPGSYVLPGLKFQWWDPEREQLRSRTVPPLAFEVAENPAWASASAAVSSEGRAVRWLDFWWILPAALVCWWPGWPLLRAGIRWLIRELRPRRLESLNP